MTPKWTEVSRELTARQHVVSVTTRLKVDGGWLYRTVLHHHDDYHMQGPVASVALVFVPKVKP